MHHLLLLCNRPAEGANAATISEHIDALGVMPGWKVWELSMLGHLPASIDLGRFDAIGIHYTLHLSHPDHYFLNEAAQERLAAFPGLKCVWLHDEYRRVNDVARLLKRLGTDVIFSLAQGATLQALYPSSILPGVRLETVFAGYVASHVLGQKTLATHFRPVDVSYRARRPPYWLGALGQEKINIGVGFTRQPAAQCLVLDISVEEHDRIYGQEWLRFLARSKAVLCVESGSSIVDFSGEVEKVVEKACNETKAITFEEVSQQYLATVDGQYLLNPISPRVFEAAAMRTVMVGFAGEYSGLMRPWEHYIPLSKDFSNIDEVVAALKDMALLERIAARAWRDLAAVEEHSYEAFSARCGKILAEELLGRSHVQRTHHPYSDTEFSKALRHSPSYLFRRHVAHRLQGLIFSSRARGLMFRIWYKLPSSLRNLIKPALRIVGR